MKPKLVRIYLNLILMMLFIVITSCGNKYVRQEIPIDRIDTSGIYINYSFNNRNYEKRFELDVSNEDFYDSDSMVVLINRTKPEEIKFQSIIHRKWPNEEVIINLNEK